MRNRILIAPRMNNDVLSFGVGGFGAISWRVESAILIAGTGLGTEVSGLTATYQRSEGNGTEEVFGQVVGEAGVDPSGLAF